MKLFFTLLFVLFVTSVYAQNIDLVSPEVVQERIEATQVSSAMIVNLSKDGKAVDVTVSYLNADDEEVKTETVRIEDKPGSCSITDSAAPNNENTFDTKGDCEGAGGVWTAPTTDWTDLKNAEVSGVKVAVEFNKAIKAKVKQIKGW